MRPQCIVTVNGQVMSGAFVERLVEAECTDAEGIVSDVVRLVLNDGPESGFLQIPDRGAIITVAMGYDNPVLLGRYTLDEVSVACLPYALEISGKSADVRKEMKENKARNWDEPTVQEIVEKIAGEHGLTPKVSGAVASYKYPWFGQLDESDLHVLERLSRRHNAIFTVKNGALIFAEKGAGQTAGGTALSSYSITPAKIVENTCRVVFADRSTYKDVVAYYQDRDGVKRAEVRVESDPEGAASYTIGEPYADEGEAEAAAGSKAKDLKRSRDRLSVTVHGDPGVASGMPLSLSGVRPGVDGLPWIAKTVKHRFQKEQFITMIDAEGQA